MSEEIRESVSVVMLASVEHRKAYPYRFKWHGREYKVKEVCMHYTERQKGRLVHCFSIDTGGAVFLLRLDTQTLFWTLEQVEAGE